MCVCVCVSGGGGGGGASFVTPTKRKNLVKHYIIKNDKKKINSIIFRFFGMGPCNRLNALS